MAKKRTKLDSLQMFLVGASLGALVILVLVFLFPVRQAKEGVLSVDPLVKVYSPPEVATPSPAVTDLLVKGLLPSGEKSVRVPVLLYHYVEYNHDPKDTIRIQLTVTPFWFEKQLQFLQGNGYHPISPSTLESAIAGRTSLPTKPVILTFDDGYRDFYTDAYPLLVKYQVPATIFVVSDFLDKWNYMFAWQLQQVASEHSGLVTVGAHTRHHVALTSIPGNEVWGELTGSKKILENLIGRPVTVFAYPYGVFNKQDINLVKQAGFTSAMSTIFGDIEGPENLYYLPRIRVGNYAGDQFAARLR